MNGVLYFTKVLGRVWFFVIVEEVDDGIVNIAPCRWNAGGRTAVYDPDLVFTVSKSFLCSTCLRTGFDIFFTKGKDVDFEVGVSEWFHANDDGLRKFLGWD